MAAKSMLELVSCAAYICFIYRRLSSSDEYVRYTDMFKIICRAMSNWAT